MRANRLTHTMEVAQLGRTMARSLVANEDLIEAICLAHDLGRPAFGRTGEHRLQVQLLWCFDVPRLLANAANKLDFGVLNDGQVTAQRAKIYSSHPAMNL